MKNNLLLLIALFAVLFPPVTHTSGAQDRCGTLGTYFENVDMVLGAAFLQVIQDEEWQADIEVSIAKANRSDMSILVLSPEEMEPLARFMAVPGDALLTIPESDVPIIARDLHESALQTWLLFPAIFRAVASGGIFGTMIFIEEMEELNAANLAAQAEIQAACPDQVAEARARSESSEGADSVVDIDDPSALEEIRPEDFEGMAYVVLFIASEDDDSAIPGGTSREDPTPASIPTPTPTPAPTPMPTSQPTSTTAITEPLPARPTRPVASDRSGGPTSAEAPTATEPGQRIISPAEATSAAGGSPDSEQLAAMLPASTDLPIGGLDNTEDSSLTQAEVVAGLGGSHEAAMNLDTWGWSGNAIRSYLAPDPLVLDPSATTNITISLHGFASEGAAAEALVYFSDVLINLGYREVAVGEIGTTNRLLVQPQEDGGTLVALYVQQGPIVYRIGGYSPAGDPTNDVLSIAKQMVND